MIFIRIKLQLWQKITKNIENNLVKQEKVRTFAAENKK